MGAVAVMNGHFSSNIYQTDFALMSAVVVAVVVVVVVAAVVVVTSIK